MSHLPKKHSILRIKLTILFFYYIVTLFICQQCINARKLIGIQESLMLDKENTKLCVYYSNAKNTTQLESVISTKVSVH